MLNQVPVSASPITCPVVCAELPACILGTAALSLSAQGLGLASCSVLGTEAWKAFSELSLEMGGTSCSSRSPHDPGRLVCGCKMVSCQGLSSLS